MKKFLLLYFSFNFALSVFAQDHVVTGKVTSNQDASALPGVNILEKGTTNGTISDSEGNYKLTVSTGGTLIFSFIGYQSQEIAVDERAIIDVQLGADTKNLSEVVVTAQGIQTEKRALGYAVTTVNGSALSQRPESDVGRLLSGKIPGVSITQTNGVSGSGTNIIIRGYTSISSTNQPLFVIDGVPFNSNTNQTGDFSSGSITSSSRFLDLDPNNIESISVLKGLGATVLYGEQGKKGVILVTTKNGSHKKKDFEVTVTQSVFFNKIASLPVYQNAYGNGYQNSYGAFLGNWGSHFRDGSAAGAYSPDSVPHPYSHFSNPALQAAFPQFIGTKVKYQSAPNNVRDFFRTGVISSTSLNLSAATEKISYNSNFSYSKEQGFIPGNNLTKFNAGIGATAQIFKKLSNTTTLNVSTTTMETPPIAAASIGGGLFGAGFSLFSALLYTPRNIDLTHLPYENPITHGSVYYRTGNDVQNPLWTNRYMKNTDNVRRLYGMTSFTYDVNEDLSLTYRVGLDTYSETQEYQAHKGSVESSLFTNGIYRTIDITNRIWDHTLLLNYTKKFNQKLNLVATLGGNIRQDDYNQNGMESTQQIVFGFMNHNNFLQHSSFSGFPDADGVITGTPLQQQLTKIWEAIYGQAVIDYNKFLYFTVAARNDWSSTLEPANNHLFYPSASVSFVPTTAFNIENEVLNFLKIRASYGSSAGFPVPYQTRNTLNANGRTYSDNGGNIYSSNSVANVLGNKNLKPELLTEIEFGVEGKLIKNRLGFDVTYFQRKTKDLISVTPLDPSTGYQNSTQNIGSLNNIGTEISLTGTPVVTKDFSWDIIANFYRYNPKVVSLNNGLQQVLVAGSSTIGNYALVGKPFNEIRGIGILRDTNGNKEVDNSGMYLSGTSPINLGNPNPDYTVTINNNFTYKGLTLSAQIDYRQGGAIYSSTASILMARGVTKDTDVGNRNGSLIVPGVRQDGSVNTTPISYSDAFYNNLLNNGISELSMYDGTTIRLRTTSLSYAIPKALIKKSGFKALSITATGFNLWYKAVNFPKYLNFDTDVLSTGVGNGLGLDFMTGPTSRRYGVSLKATF